MTLLSASNLTGYYFLVFERVVTGIVALLFDWQGILQTYGGQSSLQLDTIPWPARTPAWLAFDDSIAGSTGSDTLVGFGGNDAIRGGGGNNIMDGGAGVDTAIFAGGSADNHYIIGGFAGYFEGRTDHPAV